jgi:fimbrial isopeptide formation D2 family protein/LPXTG-motif cell wall-anchored protein
MNALTRKSITKRIGIFAVLVAMLLTLNVPLMSFADVLPTQSTGTITIHKYLLGNDAAGAPGNGQATPPTGDATALSGIPFTVTQVVPANDKDATGAVLHTENGVDYKAKSGGIVRSGNTNDQGDYATGTIPIGIYLVTEGTSDKVASPVKPFLVQVPTTLEGTGGADDSLIYDVNVYPKNSALSIDKEAVAAGGSQADATNHLPVNVGDKVDWYITADIPADIAEAGVEYAVWDKYPEGMTYDADSVVVSSGGIIFTPGVDYKIDTATARTVKIIFEDAGRAKLAAAGDNQVTVKLTTTITEDLIPSVSGKNEADISYKNEFGEDKTITTGGIDSPDVYTGGYSFQKVDATDANTKLGGAKFKLVRRTSPASTFEDDLAAAKAAAIAATPDPSATTDGYFKLPSIAGHDPSNALVASSADTTGYTVFKGIAYGQPGEEIDKASSALFWLVEVNAPDGYRLPGEAKKIEINYTSYHDAANTTTEVTNAKGFEFPLTGGMGTLIFVVGGIVLIGLAGIVIVSSRRKGRKTESVQ